MTVATVLVPTHNHGRLLFHAVESALEQTVQDIEVFIVCDGANPETLEAAAAVRLRDERVTIFEEAKGRRHGEEHRHRALSYASGRIVCYLADDDLWLPDHVELMDELLRKVDFGCTLPVLISAGGELVRPVVPVDPREWFSTDRNFTPLSAVGHTLASYRALPEGWSPAPETTYTDLFMWKKFSALGAPRGICKVPTACVFPSDQRATWTKGMRENEMICWRGAIKEDPALVRRALLGEAPSP